MELRNGQRILSLLTRTCKMNPLHVMTFNGNHTFRNRSMSFVNCWSRTQAVSSKMPQHLHLVKSFTPCHALYSTFRGHIRGMPYLECHLKQLNQGWSHNKLKGIKRQTLDMNPSSLGSYPTSLRMYSEIQPKNVQKPDKKKDHFQYKNWGTLLTIPNFLTFSRIALTPYLGHLVLSESYAAACGLFLFAGITDVLDGWIARRFPSQSSPVGSFMDPLADKFLVSTLFISLTIVNLIPAPLTCLVVARDVSLIAAAFYVRIISLPPPVTVAAVFDLSSQTAELKPTLISKANTAVQLGLVMTTLVAPVIDCVDHPALQTLWYITAGTTLWSGIGYIFAKDTFEIYKQRRQKEN